MHERRWTQGGRQRFGHAAFAVIVVGVAGLVAVIAAIGGAKPQVRTAAESASVETEIDRSAPMLDRIMPALVTVTPTSAPVSIGVAKRRGATVEISERRSLTDVLPAIDGGGDGVTRIALWGDSLAYEAEEYFAAAFERFGIAVRVETGTFGGTALCDFVDPIAERLAVVAFDVIVLAFSGNALTPCMHDQHGAAVNGEIHTAAYAVALDSVLEMARRHGATVVLAGGPTSAESTTEALRLAKLYAQRAASRPDVVTANVDAALLWHHQWTPTLPCLDIEGPAEGCVDGRIAVRSPDRIHFCPGSGHAIDGVTGRCARWSSGAYRYAQALAAPVIAALT